MGKRRLILPPVDTDNRLNPVFKIKAYDHVNKHFLVICRLGEGDYFGVGENFSEMSIISVNKVGTACRLLNISTEISATDSSPGVCGRGNLSKKTTGSSVEMLAIVSLS